MSARAKICLGGALDSETARRFQIRNICRGGLGAVNDSYRRTRSGSDAGSFFQFTTRLLLK